MNLTKTPTLDQLKAVIAAADDSAGNHIMWVDVHGEVRMSVVDRDLTPVGFEEKHARTLKLRYETCDQNAGYVGEEAAKDEALMERLYRSLLKEWDDRPGPGKSQYVDDF